MRYGEWYILIPDTDHLDPAADMPLGNIAWARDAQLGILGHMIWFVWILFLYMSYVFIIYNIDLAAEGRQIRYESIIYRVVNCTYYDLLIRIRTNNYIMYII